MKILRTLLVLVLSLVGLAFLILFVSGQKIQASAQSGPASVDSEVIGFLPGDFSVMDVSGDYVYLLGEGMLHVIDVSQPSAPMEVGVLADIPPEIGRLFVNGDYAYASYHGLYSLDVSNPTAPSLASYLHLSEEADYFFAYDVAWAADTYVQVYRYQSSGHPRFPGYAEFQFVDVTNPISPSTMFTTTASPDANLIYLGGNLMVANYPQCSSSIGYCRDRLAIYDNTVISDPVHLTWYDLSPYPFEQFVSDIIVVDGFVYVALAGGEIEPSGLLILDVADPTQPTEVAFFTTTMPSVQLDVLGDRVYLLENTHLDPVTDVGNLWVLDVSTPENPQVVGYYGGVDATEVEATDDYIYLLNRHGLLILRNAGLTVSGRIGGAHALPFAGIEVSLNPGLTATTNISGEFSFRDLPAGSYTLTADLPGYRLWPEHRLIQLPPNHDFQDFMVLPAPISSTIYPADANWLIFTDTQDLPTRFDFLTGTVPVTATVWVTPTYSGSEAGYAFAGHAFEISVAPESGLEAAAVFSQPVTVTIQYSMRDVWGLIDEGGLALWQWSGSAWVDAAQTCTPESSYERDLDNNMIRMAFCQPGPFILVGPTHQSYLAVITR